MSYHGPFAGSTSMADFTSENVRLLLHRGVSFCDAVFVRNNSEILLSRRWLYSKHKFKSVLESLLKPFAGTLTEVVLLDEFADRLSGLRLGGSVAAVFPKGLEQVTSFLQTSPIHSESVILVEPLQDWSDTWMNESLELLKKHTIKRIAWQCFPPAAVLDKFKAEGFENFCIPEDGQYAFLHWRRNLLNASCSGPIHEMTEEVQTTLQQIECKASVKWLDEDFTLKDSTLNRYGLTSAWTHLMHLWAQKNKATSVDLFILDWDGCFKIGQPQATRWTPWGEVNCIHPLPEVSLLKQQPTQTLEKNVLGEWQWIGKSDQFEPGPVFLGRGLKPTLLDLVIEPELFTSQFEVKSIGVEKLNRQLSSQLGFKNIDELNVKKLVLKQRAIEQWSNEIFHMASTDEIYLLGPLVETVLPTLDAAGFKKIHAQNSLPDLHELGKNYL